jgi:hypothetical protein
LDINKDEISCREDKCSLCGRRDNVFSVEVQIPDYSKGVIIKDKNLCSKCLEAVDEVYLRHIDKKTDEKGFIHGHEHVNWYPMNIGRNE